MTYEQAQKILARVREGVHYPAAIVDKALFLTGDLDRDAEDGGQGVDQTLQGEGQREWFHASQRLVGRRYFGH